VTSALRRGTRIGEERLEFRFDGKTYVAQRGDSAASALLAGGVRVFGRSIKYRRGRGLLSAGPEEPNALLTAGDGPNIIPNIPAPQLVLTPGVNLLSQNRWPSLRFDRSAILRLGGGVLGAGFYYKTFIWPSWHAYEGTIRRLAGLGAAPRECALDPPAVLNVDCDVLVAGAGAAGLAAALAAARAGARVVICEREVVCGGELEFETADIDGRHATFWVQETVGELKRRGARVLASTTVVGGSNGLVIALSQPAGWPGSDTVYRIQPRAFVAATGATERPLAFIDNDRPGVMLVGAAERYLARYGVRVAKSAVLFGNHDRLYAAATRLMAGGIRVGAIVDTRAARDSEPSSSVRSQLSREGVECLTAHTVTRARGWLEVNGAEIAPLDSSVPARIVPCDALLMSGGWTPEVHAGLHEGGAATFLPQAAAFSAGAQPDWRMLCGASAGAFELENTLADGHRAGLWAAGIAGKQGNGARAPRAQGDPPAALEPYWRAPAARAAEKRQFVDYQNDVTVADLRQALAEGFRDIEHVKRYTTLGVGTEQGRTSTVLGAAILAELDGRSLSQVGPFRTRAPYHPVTLNALAGWRAGPAVQPARHTPLHDWHAAHGGVLEIMGYWVRPRYYRANGSDAFAAGCAEARRVRTHGGILDGSTLGKMEIAGPAAGELLDRLYLTRASTIKVGRGRYMVNLREDGMVLDDGLVLRLADDRFLATTSSGHGAHMLSHFEFYRDTEWAGRPVTITDVTEAWAVIVCAGPRSRATLAGVLGEAWSSVLSRLAHMEFASGVWQGSTVRLLRASFSGELAFEVHCRPGAVRSLWEALVAAGLAPYGLEAVDILRVEKGYLVHSEMNGQTTPMDLGMDGLLRQSDACVGRDLLDRPAFHEPERPRLVGVRAADGRSSFLAGAQLTTAEDPRRSLGYVTSSAFSPTLGEWIGLALLDRRHAVDGNSIMGRDPVRSGDTLLKVTPAIHFDPASERMRS
jgi:methylglutamate dehydrogenase subunit C